MWKDNDSMPTGSAEDLMPDAAAEARKAAERIRKETEEIEQAAIDKARRELKQANEDNSGLFDEDAQSGVDSFFGKDK